MGDQEQAARVASQAKVVEQIRETCEEFAAGAVTYRRAIEAIKTVIEEETRIVRVGNVHKPEVQT
ncbi:MAG: hypothetical protein HQ464_02505 [Planctomycetes bacterium]|nr:hypothetical protein [Planctomycetota bacterium]